MEKNEKDLHATYLVAIGATREGMEVVRKGQLSGKAAVQNKADGSQVTETDIASGEAIEVFLRKYFPNMVYKIEDLIDTTKTASYVWLIDPLDGTGPYSIGAHTSAISIALFDTILGEVVLCVVGDPASGRIWTGRKNRPSELIHGNEASTITTSEAGLEGGYFCFDERFGFQPNGIEILSDDQQHGILRKILDRGCHQYNFGANVTHHALVANGQGAIIGALTGNKGGSHDIAPALIVQGASGFIQGWKKTKKGFEKVSGLDSIEADILLSTNNEENGQLLVEAIEQGFLL